MKLPYVRTMFATCMLFQTIYAACVLLWVINPTLAGHGILPAIIPNFTYLSVASFLYGFLAMMIYGWIIAIVFVFFYNLWPRFSRAVGLREEAWQ